jgi:hypothetical protein
MNFKILMNIFHSVKNIDTDLIDTDEFDNKSFFIMLAINNNTEFYETIILYSLTEKGAYKHLKSFLLT